ncbi:class I SAM-dependent methyltransferase [Janibacter cremeus]|uniref:2-polyprenyl-3-methyl-5-hydroxy-6-metoxy-1, 4-benzoquinol methylase n=1 Tax=Janibacter cremeus TaxID=1285192 RepID=A0A852VRT4_9MICO|nr:class I SAM-dependent methyltransferase [Janibacter cremeus]NYF98140.1 2-polyprenyl-3-methyl-5-hydroxy-6-metoxy-1,4-benzoquinol methylase [Janibacter cremeus]
MVPETSGWMQIVAEDPNHSQWYIERFREMAARGDDLDGEARLVDAMVARGARVLDAGCGPGRIGGRLHELGHEVTGADVDPALIAAAEEDHPGPRWLVSDLAVLDVRDEGGERRLFDLIVCAGNVMTFLAPSTRGDVLAGFAEHLDEDGRVVIGFGAERGYEFADFRADTAAAGLTEQVLLGGWALEPFAPDGGYIVATFGR